MDTLFILYLGPFSTLESYELSSVPKRVNNTIISFTKASQGVEFNTHKLSIQVPELWVWQLFTLTTVLGFGMSQNKSLLAKNSKKLNVNLSF